MTSVDSVVDSSPVGSVSSVVVGSVVGKTGATTSPAVGSSSKSGSSGSS